MLKRLLAFGVVAALCLAWTGLAQATPAPRDPSERLPPPPRITANGAGLLKLVQALEDNREGLKSNRITYAGAMARGGLRVRGVRSMAVLPFLYKNSPDERFATADLQRQLFTGPWQTGTLADYYRQVSYGLFTVTGTVQPWQRASNDDTYYEGADYLVAGDPVPRTCNGRCDNARVPELVTEVLRLQDASVDFRQYDNDGPDGKPNSGDDNGAVDFLVLVQPEIGAECPARDRNVHSHQTSFTDRGMTPYATQDTGWGGQPIRVDSYAILPAVACDDTTMIQIGIFAHEFGHALGLPDLYDTDEENGTSAGIGVWGLMGTGSWGADGFSPAMPTHMSAWEKAQLGWVQPILVRKDLKRAHLHPVERQDEVYRIDVAPGEYYLVEYRHLLGFDRQLPGSGLLVWKINERAIEDEDRIWYNNVNADAANKGVALVEADGSTDLDTRANEGDFGDMFRGQQGRLLFDGTTSPASRGAAMCDIGVPGAVHTLRILVSRKRCARPR